MSASADLQEAIHELLPASALPASDIPVLRRRPKQARSEIEEAIAKQQLCVVIMPPLPSKAMDANGPILFFENYEVRVRIIEQPKINTTGSDAYETADAVALALHWSNPGGILTIPMKISPGRPMEMIEDPQFLIIDVCFNAALQINKE